MPRPSGCGSQNRGCSRTRAWTPAPTRLRSRRLCVLSVAFAAGQGRAECVLSTRMRGRRRAVWTPPARWATWRQGWVFCVPDVRVRSPHMQAGRRSDPAEQAAKAPCVRGPLLEQRAAQCLSDAAAASCSQGGARGTCVRRIPSLRGRGASSNGSHEGEGEGAMCRESVLPEHVPAMLANTRMQRNSSTAC